MTKTRVAVIGAGNIGKAAIKSVLAAPDMELAGVVNRRVVPIEDGVKLVSDISELGKVDVALVGLPTREVAETAEKLLLAGYNTVDSFDVHGEIPALQKRLGEAAIAGNAVAVISAGWDPGSDSIIRVLMEAMAPRGITATDFGPGMSMGHTVAVKAIQGVADALSITIPKGSGLHRRMVYVQVKEGADFAKVEAAILADDYFKRDETHVTKVDDVSQVLDVGHGVVISRKGGSGAADNQQFSYEMRIHNPALTAQVMLCAARAAMRQKPGCYTTIELPPIDLLPGDRAQWIKKLV